MKAFSLNIPTKVIFGNGESQQSTGSAVASFGKKVLLTYGKESIKRTGTYSKIIDSLKAVGIDEITEFSGIKSNPSLSHLKEGIELARTKQIDVILAVGGGSVMDEAKGIAAGVFYDGEVWDFYSGQAAPQKALPVIAVPTDYSADAGIDALEQWFESIQSPTRLSAVNIPAEDIPSIAEDAINLGTVWGITDYTHENVVSILKSAV